MLTIQISILIGSILVLMVFYSVYIVRLRWYLEEKYPDELGKLNFGKKISRLCYYSTPKQAKNVMRFIFSHFNYNDATIKELKTRLRLVIYLSIVWLIALIFSTLIFPEIL